MGKIFGWCLVALLAACSSSPLQGKAVVSSASSSMESGLRHEATAQVTVRISPQELRGVVDQEAEIWRRGRQALIAKLATEFLMRRMVLPLPSSANTFGVMDAYTQKGAIAAVREEATGDVVQSFQGSLTLDATQAAIGRVVGLETDGYMAGSQQRVYVALPGQSVSLPAYVAFLKEQSGAGEGWYRLGAIGELMQANEALMDGSIPAVLGNVEIIMADRETEVGDLAVLLFASVEALEQKPAAAAASDEVVVTPHFMPTVTEPKIKK
ncbi:hypothetical protein [Thermodesulfomicrobium sp. WS]|uniref:hypothetical protein n=1 Tax=Thermodesulfomicrobium sp. WS TaxID=3004129 RepID=UPI0024911A06|nr:hypothetical protein [Thermodesulfomicrobium sp. WS]